MARDKQIVIRIEEEKRKSLKQYCSERNIEVGKLLYDIIGKLLDGSLSLDSTSQANAIQSLDISEQIAQEVAQQLVPIREELDSVKKALTGRVKAKKEILPIATGNTPKPKDDRRYSHNELAEILGIKSGTIRGAATDCRNHNKPYHGYFPSENATWFEVADQ